MEEDKKNVDQEYNSQPGNDEPAEEQSNKAPEDNQNFEDEQPYEAAEENQDYEEEGELQDEEPNLIFERYENAASREYETYFQTHYQFLAEAEEYYKKTFKEMLDIEEINVFFDIELTKNIDDVGFYLYFEEFNAREDPDKVRTLIQECQEILLSNQTNLEVDNKTVDQVNDDLFIFLLNK